MEENQEKSNDTADYYGSGIINRIIIEIASKEYPIEVFDWNVQSEYSIGMFNRNDGIKKKGWRTDEIMEDEILEKAVELRDLILNSDEYTKFQQYRARLMKEEELYRKVNEFREKNFELQITGDSANASLVDHLTQQYSNILEKPAVCEYMQAELMLCRKLQQMYRTITEKIDMDLNFL